MEKDLEEEWMHVCVRLYIYVGSSHVKKRFV